MTEKVSRRGFLKTAALTVSASALPVSCGSMNKKAPGKKGELHLGLMSYTMARDWDIETVIKNCAETKFEAVELRTTHAHGIEISLSKEERLTVKKRFEDSPVKLKGLASGFAYHFADKEELKKSIEGTKEYVVLAHDVGAEGIRVFPNMLLVDKGIPEEQTIEQVGASLKEVGEHAKDYNVAIRVCAHGRGTARIPIIKKILNAADCSNVYVNWNCNPTDSEDGGLDANFNLVRDKIFSLHMHELCDDYPYRRLFELLVNDGFNGYCYAEIPGSSDPIRVMNYYRALFLALQDII